MPVLNKTLKTTTYRLMNREQDKSFDMKPNRQENTVLNVSDKIL